MATFRKVHVQFWGDPYIQDLTPEQKFFYLYILTNSQTKQCGIYEITLKQICYDTGYNIDTVSKLLEYCINTDKIRFNKQTNEIAIKNWNKYNGSDSPKVQSCVNQELRLVKDENLILYLYGTDTVEILNRNKNKNKNKIQEENKIESPSKNNFINSNLNRQPVIPSQNEVWEFFKGAGGDSDMAKSFWEKHDGVGWFLNGSPITNFRSLANKFIDNWKRNENKINQNGKSTTSTVGKEIKFDRP